MKTQLLAAFIPLFAVTATALPSTAQEAENMQQSANSSPQEMFRCDLSQDTPSTIITGMMSSENPNPKTLINWSEEYFSSPERALSLCQEVSQKLQTFHEEGQLTSLSLMSGEVDGESVICLKNTSESGCNPEQVLFPLETDKNPDVVLYELIAADFKPPRTRGDFPTRINFGVFNFL